MERSPTTHNEIVHIVPMTIRRAELVRRENVFRVHASLLANAKPYVCSMVFYLGTPNINHSDPSSSHSDFSKVIQPDLSGMAPMQLNDPNFLGTWGRKALPDSCLLACCIVYLLGQRSCDLIISV